MIVDSQIHLWAPETPDRPWIPGGQQRAHLPEPLTYQKFLPMMDEAARFNRLLTDFLALDSSVSQRELQLKEEWRRRVR